MENLNILFEKQGTIFLDYVNYDILTLEYNPSETLIEIDDKFDLEFVEDRTKLKVLFTRYVHHNPKKLYQLTVRFGAVFTFTKEALKNNAIYDKDYATFFKNNHNRLISNIISRTSLLISHISTSNGNEPLVTQPFFIQK